MVKVLIIVLILLTLALLAGVALRVVRRRPTAVTKPSVARSRPVTAVGFRWKYVLLPLIALALSVFLVIIFYGQLPGQVGYHFTSDGSPDRFLSRTIIMLILLLPQLILVFVAFLTTWGATKAIGSLGQAQTTVDPGRILLIMGNMMSLPQFVLFFAMLDIFSYNAYGVHIIPIWASAILVMGVGAVALIYFFIRLRRRA